MKKVLTVSFVISAIILSGCFKDVAVKPNATFETYIIDSIENEVYTDTAIAGQEVYFRSTGEGEYFVAWPGEKRISLSGYTYDFTKEGIDALVNQFIPDSIIERLQVLDGKSFANESKASTSIFNAIGKGSREQIIWDTYYTYEYQIKVSAVTLNPDSTYFNYNHVYTDFTERFDKGYYNVNGITVEIGKTDTKYIYKLPGIYTVHFVARGVEDYGASIVEDVATKQIVIKPNI